MKINEKIRDIRASKCISQEYMASQLGIDTSSYHRIERGVTPLSVTRFERIAKVLDVDIITIISQANGNPKDSHKLNPGYVKHLEEEVQFLRRQLQEKLAFIASKSFRQLPSSPVANRRNS